MMKWITLVATVAFTFAAYAQDWTIYVSPDGDDENDGASLQTDRDGVGPVQTIEHALTLLKARSWNGATTIRLAPGTYTLEETITLDKDAGGSSAGPVTITGFGADSTYIMAGRFIEGFEKVSDSAVLERIDASARDHVVVTDLKAQGITEYGSAGGGGLELFFEGDAMQIARWPNEGFTKIVEEAGGEKFEVHGQPGDKIGKWVYDGDRPSRWADEKDPWLNGYWFWDWSSQYHQIESIDTENKTIKVKEPYHGYGYRKGQWYYALNMLSELDAPGEWYLDREAGKLYFWPPSKIEDADVYVSLLNNAIVLEEASHVSIRDLAFEGARGTVIQAKGGEAVQIVGCTVSNSGGNGISLSGTGHSVVGCDVFNVGGGGIYLSGGDRAKLQPSNHVAENNHIYEYARWHRMYHPGIGINGVGVTARRNLIENAPHMAIQFGGNNHVIEYNEIHSVCYESNDAGAIYAGRDWTQRGTVIRYNFMHNIMGFENDGCVGVYLDDMFSGTHIHGNLFYKVYRAAFIGGGRDVTYENNLFVDCPRALHIDARAMGWAKYHLDTTMRERLEAMPYKSDHWKEQYPQLLNILEDEPEAPKGNAIANNIFIGENWNDINEDAKPYIEMRDNIADTDLDLENRIVATGRPTPAATDFTVVTPEGFTFEPLPTDKMGLYESDERATWPVEHEVRKSE